MRVPLTALLLVTGCAGNALLPEPDRVALDDSLAAHARYLKVSFYVTPFFHEDTAWLLTDRGRDDADYVDPNDQKRLDPGAPVGILPVGTLLRIERISWPTGLTMVGREPDTPRDCPWIYLRPVDSGSVAAHLSAGKPFIVVLRGDLRTRDDMQTEIDRFLTSQNPIPELRNVSVTFVDAVDHKNLVAGMAPLQVQQAWGYPEHIHIDAPKRTQLWTWPSGKQQAWFQDEVLVRWDDHGKLGGESPPEAAPPLATTPEAATPGAIILPAIPPPAATPPKTP
jgi:hypothetical protein